jgi:hypothetical protein
MMGQRRGLPGGSAPVRLPHRPGRGGLPPLNSCRR